MVRPEEEKGLITRTLEDRLADKFDALQSARETREPYLFDEIARSIEILLKAIPDAYIQLTAEKNELNTDLSEEMAHIEQKAESAGDQIWRDATLSNESFVAQWEYREAYEEIIIELMQRWKLVPIRLQVYGGVEPIQTVEETPQPEPQPEPKPRLSVFQQRQQAKQQPQQQNFEV